MSTIADQMLEAAKHSQSVQSLINDEIDQQKAVVLDDHIVATIIAGIIQTFKQRGEQWARTAPGTESDNTATRRKRINNIINDVSRICRKRCKHSIVNTKRSGGVWEYEAQIPKPRGAIANPHTPGVGGCGLEHFDTAVHIRLSDITAASAEHVIEWLVTDRGHDIEELGRAVAAKLKAREAA